MTYYETKDPLIVGRPPSGTFCWQCGTELEPDPNGRYSCVESLGGCGCNGGTAGGPGTNRAAVWDKTERTERNPVVFEADYDTVPYIDHSVDHYLEPSCTGPLPNPLEEK